MSVSVTVTITVYDIDGDPLEGVSVVVYDKSGTGVAASTTNSSGVYAPSISTTDETPTNEWKVTVGKTGYFGAAVHLVFTDATTAAQTFYLVDNPVLPSITVDGGVRGAVTAGSAAGSGQSDGVALVEGLNVIDSANSSKAAVLPPAVKGMEVWVVNTVSGQTLPVYPASGGQIDWAGSDTSVTVAGRKTRIFRASSTTQWYSVLTA